MGFQVASLFALAVLAASPAAHADGDAARGRELYEDECSACHAVDENRFGPRHRGVYGRAAGSVSDYAYSMALRDSKIIWGADALDKWLADPQAFVPGQKMNVKVDDPQDRADLIAYLTTLSK